MTKVCAFIHKSRYPTPTFIHIIDHSIEEEAFLRIMHSETTSLDTCSRGFQFDLQNYTKDNSERTKT